MKKQYEAPKAEKVEFDYSEMVTASGPCQISVCTDSCDYNSNTRSGKKRKPC